MTISDAEYEAANKVGAKMMKRGPIVVFAAYDDRAVAPCS